MLVRDRLRQVERWLNQNYPVREVVRVRVSVLKTADMGYCSRTDSGWVIHIHKSEPLGPQIHTLLHEWAHAHPRCLNHGAAWGRKYQAIYYHWFDAGGAEESNFL